MIIPSFCPFPVPIRLSTSSGTLRATSWTALTEEWDQMTGAFECNIACVAVRSEVCDRSTNIPIRFISSISLNPIVLDNDESDDQELRMRGHAVPQTIVQWSDLCQKSTRVSKCIVTCVSESHISNTECVILSEHRDRVS